MVRAGRLAAVLELPAGDLRFFRPPGLPEQKWRADALCERGARGRADFLSHTEQFRGQSVQGAGCAGSRWRAADFYARGRQRAHATFAISGDGDSSPESLFRVHRIHDSLCVCAGRAAGAVSGREVDSSDAQVDDDRVVLPDDGNFARRTLGLRRFCIR